MKICKRVLSFKKENNYWLIMTNACPIRIWFLTDDIIRLRVGFDSDFTEKSYTLMMTAWEDELDVFIGKERVRIESSDTDIEENREIIRILGKKLSVEIEKKSFRISILNQDKEILHRDISELSYMLDDNNRRIHTSEIFKGDFFYGFGEKTGSINKSEKFMVMSSGDAMGYNPKERDSLYKHIPFYIKLNENTNNAVGYFYHNMYECDFNMGRSHSNYWPAHSRYRTDGGDIDLFFINGPKVRDVVERYTDITGKSAMLPKAALGYLGSSMYYSEISKDCDDLILEFIDTNKEEQIAIDGFQLSSGYTVMDTEIGPRRCVFEWNYDRFKNPKKFFENMTEKGIVVSPNVKPGILTVHPKIKELEDIFIKDSEEDKPAVGDWWGGEGHLVDFTKPLAREKWKKLLTENVLDMGTLSIWNDNCEYDSIVDKSARCDFDGKGGTLAELKPIMANLMCRLTVEAIEEKDKNIRPFVVCRAGYSGIQKYAQTWAGDNLTCWDSLKYNIAVILGMGISGVANHGCDIGGFYGEPPSEELLVRWIQNGIFQPRFSVHSVNTDNTVTEPWMYSSSKKLIADTIQFRYQLIPYIYSLMVRANQKGLPIMEPLFSAFQDDKNCYNEGINFMFGDSLLVANVVDEGAAEKEIYLPKGTNFYDFYTRKMYEGGQTITIPVTLKDIPLFIKGGGIVPFALNPINNLSKCYETKLKLLCADDVNGSFELYEDDGYSNEYLKGEYLKTKIDMTVGLHTKLAFEFEGKYKTNIEDMYIDLIHRANAPFSVKIGNREVPRLLHRAKFEAAKEGWYYSMSLRSVQIKYKNINENYVLDVSYEEFDMIGM